MAYILNRLLSFVVLICFCVKAQAQYNSKYKQKIVDDIIAHVTAKEGIDLKNVDSTISTDIYIDASSIEITPQGDILGWSIRINSDVYSDSALMKHLEEKFSTPFVTVAQVSSDYDKYGCISASIGAEALFGRRRIATKEYNSLIIERPTFLGWAPVQILEYLCYGASPESEYVYFNQEFKSFMLEVPVTVTKNSEPGKSMPQCKRYVYVYHIYTMDFKKMQHKLEQVLYIGEFYRK